MELSSAVSSAADEGARAEADMDAEREIRAEDAIAEQAERLSLLDCDAQTVHGHGYSART